MNFYPLTKNLDFKPSLEITFVLALTIFSLITSLININFPAHKIFDEVYRVTRAEMFLHGQSYFSPQPRFGKYLLILGMLVFGDNPIGWRIIQAVTSSLVVPIGYLIAKKIFKYKYSGLLTAFFLTFEPTLLAYSRVGVTTSNLIFFRTLSLLLFILATENKDLKSNILYFLCAITTGLTIAIKWTGLSILPTFWLWTKIKNDLKNTLSKKLSFTILFLAIVVLTYTLTFVGEVGNFQYDHLKYNMPDNNFIEGIISWHKLAFNTHLHTHNNHPCSSKWYTWPFMYKPVLMYWSFDTISKKITCILGLGNPIIWWSGILAILFQLFLLFYKRDKIMIFLLGSYFISLLPFAFITRPMFLYHYLSPLFILILILEYTFVNLYKEKKYLRPVLMLLISLVVAMFFYFYPFVNGYPVSIDEYRHRLWFKNWREYTSSIRNILEHYP